MREIKFRAWDKSAKEWLYSVNSLERFLSLVYGHSTPNEFGDVQQYTGLKDKNGKEIYEGDILKSPYNGCHAVYWGKGGFRLDHKNCCAPYKGSISEAEGWQEIIGNIYENKDLLK